MKRTLIMGIFLAGFTAASFAQSNIKGYWLAGEGNTIVEISELEDGALQGKIVWMKRPVDKKGQPHKDKNNPDRSLRNRTLMGLPMIERLDYENDNWSGKMYSPKNGKTVDVSFALRGEDQLKVQVKFRGFKREQTWYRTELPK